MLLKLRVLWQINVIDLLLLVRFEYAFVHRFSAIEDCRLDYLLICVKIISDLIKCVLKLFKEM